MSKPPRASPPDADRPLESEERPAWSDPRLDSPPPPAPARPAPPQPAAPPKTSHAMARQVREPAAGPGALVLTRPGDAPPSELGQRPALPAPPSVSAPPKPAAAARPAGSAHPTDPGDLIVTSPGDFDRTQKELRAPALPTSVSGPRSTGPTEPERHAPPADPGDLVLTSPGDILPSDEPPQSEGDGSSVLSASRPATPPQAPAPKPAGPVLQQVSREHYAPMGEFARGGIGRILKARDLRLNRLVALKELLDPGGPGEARFIAEAMVTARLQHPAIVPVHEAGRWPTGEPFYSMKLVSGRPLSRLISEATSLSKRLALVPNVLIVAEAIAYAHSEGVIHRDLKPANVLVGKFGETVVIDWGLAKDLAASPREPASPSPLTEVGTVIGTPTYMAPEQAAGQPVDERADVYALGAILYHLLSGEPPYYGQTSHQIIRNVLAQAPDPLRERQRGIPGELLDIVEKAMARKLEERYRSAQELAEELRRFLTGNLVKAHRYSRVERIRRALQRQRAAFVVAAGALAVLAVIGAVSFRRILSERDRAEAAERLERRRADDATLMQVRATLDQDPTRALESLRSLSPDFPRWGAVRVLAADARERGLATVLRGHGDAAVRAIRFSPDGTLLASASDDKTIRLWRLDGRGSRVLTGHTDEVWSLVFSRNGKQLISSGKDGTVRLWDVASGASRTLGHAQAEELVLTPNGKHLILSDRSGALEILDVESGRTRQVLGPGKHRPILALSPDGQFLAYSDIQQSLVTLWNIPLGRPELDAQLARPALHIAFSPRGDVFATGQAQGGVDLWRVPDGRRTTREVREGVSGLAFSPDGSRLAIRAYDATLRFWEVETGRFTAPRRDGEHDGATSSPTFSTDGRYLAAGGEDRILKLWDVSEDRFVLLRGHDSIILQVAFSPDGRHLATAGLESAIRLYELPIGNGRVLEVGDGMEKLAVSPDDQHLAAAGYDGRLRLWDLGRNEYRELQGHQRCVGSVAFSPQGEWLASSDATGGIRLWDYAGQTKRVLERYEGGEAPSPLVSECAQAPRLLFSPDGQQLATPRPDGSVRLHELASGNDRVLTGARGALAELAFSPDGVSLAAGGEDRTLWLWEVATGRKRALGTHEAPIQTLAFSPDGRYLASAAADEVISLWSAQGGKPLFQWSAGGLGIRRVRFSPDSGTLYATSFGDGVLRRWDVKTGQPLPPLRARSRGSILDFALSRDGRRMVVTGSDEVIHVLDVDSGEERALRGHGQPVVTARFLGSDKWIASLGRDGTARLWPDDLPGQTDQLRAWVEAETAALVRRE